ARVVLPHPLSPAIPSEDPRGMANETPSTPRRYSPGAARAKSPRRSGKYFWTASAAISGPLAADASAGARVMGPGRATARPPVTGSGAPRLPRRGGTPPTGRVRARAGAGFRRGTG